MKQEYRVRPVVLYTRLLTMQKPYLPLFVVCSVLYSVAIFLIFTAVGVLLRSVLQLAQGEVGTATVGQMGIYLIAIACFAVLSGFSSVGFTWCDQRMQFRLRRQMLCSYLHADELATQSLPLGDLLARMTTDLPQALNLVGYYMTSWIWTPIFSGALSLLYLFHVDWVIAALCAVCSLGNFVVTHTFSKGIQTLSTRVAERKSESIQLVDEAIRGRQEVRCFKLQSLMQHRLRVQLDQLAKAVIVQTGLLARRNALNSFFSGLLVYLAVLLGGAALAAVGRVNFADVILGLPLSDQIAQMFTAFGKLIPTVDQFAPNAARIFEVIDMPQEKDSAFRDESVVSNFVSSTKEEQPAFAKTTPATAVSFEHVAFTYPGTVSPILQDFSLSIPSGAKVAITGSSGCGKTTILRLLMRLYKVDQGNIFVDGHSQSDMKIDAWRAYLSVMLQETTLLPCTLAQNIAMSANPILERVRKAAQQAEADTFITALPEGYNTLPAQGGGGFSGGQLQRIALARALYRHSPILLLDEPTSALDEKAELEIARTILSLPRNCTVIAITHNEHIAKLYDVCYEIHNGKVIRKVRPEC